ncbi:hypothetical protein GCM10010121_085810 [Streptomyces brasiliensis]|uniref:Uncharacterized protein n=1 Tax=Streptomyces brasiliensis TaxID=1954 RepID=A0A917P547_9ACTN|nr:hypothetical protein GCM10010121_085810 [Streptomyces brasiliensis]
MAPDLAGAVAPTNPGEISPAISRFRGRRLIVRKGCSCSMSVFAARTDVLLSIGRRPRLADLYAEVEHARGDSFRADWRIRGQAYPRTGTPPAPSAAARRCGP